MQRDYLDHLDYVLPLTEPSCQLIGANSKGAPSDDMCDEVVPLPLSGHETSKGCALELSHA